jgi:hypothetical protein
VGYRQVMHGLINETRFPVSTGSHMPLTIGWAFCIS